MRPPLSDDDFFDALTADEPAALAAAPPAPSTLKSRVYSRLVREQQLSGPLLHLGQTGGLCVFEEAVRVIPAVARLKQANYCRVCHARILGEHVDDAPIAWGNCPYVLFQGR